MDCIRFCRGSPRVSKTNVSRPANLTFGSYQLKQAKFYTKEHMSEEGNYNIDVHAQAPGMPRCRIQSRHINAKRYFCWIEYNTEAVAAQSIVAWTCLPSDMCIYNNSTAHSRSPPIFKNDDMMSFWDTNAYYGTNQQTRPFPNSLGSR